MKKYLIIALALVLCLAFALPALAEAPEAPYANAGELYESWYRDNPGVSFPYPEWICGVVSMDGTMDRLNFYILDGTPESEKEALLALVRDKSSIAFVEGGRYSLAELTAIQETLAAEMAAKGDELGFWGMGIDETGNCLVLDVDVSAPGAADFIKRVTAEYGDRVRVNEIGGGSTFETTTTGVDIGGEGPAPVNYNTGAMELPAVGAETPQRGAVGYWPLVAAAVAAGLILLFLLRKRAVPQPADGPEGAAKKKRLPAPIQVEAAVLSAAEQPDGQLREKILERIRTER